MYQGRAEGSLPLLPKTSNLIDESHNSEFNRSFSRQNQEKNGGVFSMKVTKCLAEWLKSIILWNGSAFDTEFPSVFQRKTFEIKDHYNFTAGIFSTIFKSLKVHIHERSR